MSESDEFLWRQVKDAKGYYAHQAKTHAYPGPGWDGAACASGDASHCEIPWKGRIEDACEVMHDAYERAAAVEGWETQERSRKPWADVPEANKATMRAAVAALLDWLTTEEMRS